MLRFEDLHVFLSGVAAVRGVSLEVPMARSSPGRRQRRRQDLDAECDHGSGGPARQIRLCWVRHQPALDRQIVRRGVVQVAQGRQLFPDMTVLEIWKWAASCQPAQSFRTARKVFANFMC